MSSNAIRPEEWPDLVEAIRNGDPSAGARLVERERRFDNYFASGTYKPTATQTASLTASTVAFETYGAWVRMGDWVQVQASFRSTSAGTLSGRMLVSVPLELPIAASDRTPSNNVVDITIPRGQFTWVDDSTAPDGIITGTAVSFSTTMIGGYISGLQASTESFIYIGEGAAHQIASGDWLKINVAYFTRFQPLV